MKIVFGAIGLLAAWATIQDAPREKSQVFILTGDLQGSLGPCGCTRPMIGGIKRRGTAIEQFADKGAILLENARLVQDTARQSQLKAETVAQSDRKLDFTAINLGADISSGGPGLVLQLQGLAQGRFIASQVSRDNRLNLRPYLVKGEFLIGGVQQGTNSLNGLRETITDTKEAVEALVTEAKQRQFHPVLMLDGPLGTAKSLAEAYPEIALIEYRQEGSATAEPVKVGDTWLVSPGSEGKTILRLDWRGGRFEGFQRIDLVPGFADHPAVATKFDDYLRRVSDEKLLDKLPRGTSPAFVGSQSCFGCHKEASKIWSRSKHSNALEALEKVKEDRDPDCVGCHVTGLQFTTGFWSRKRTPFLTNVGCEACHGPGVEHIKNPKVFHMIKSNQQTCVSCHNAQNSPNFNFTEQWKIIAHH